MHRQYSLNVRSRAAALALAVAALVVGGFFLALGLVLLAGFAAAGAVLAVGFVLYRKLTGRVPGWRHLSRRQAALDPELEVFPEDPSVRRSVGKSSAE